MSARTLINTIPKAGGHLLEKVVRLLPGSQAAGVHLEQFALPADRSPAAKAQFQTVPLNDLARALASIGPGCYATAHLLFSRPLADLVTGMGMKVLGILRDPRDMAVSFAKYVSQTETHYLFGDYQKRSEADQLMISIVGMADVQLSDAVADAPRLLDIGRVVSGMLPWTKLPGAYTTSFEKLVGPAGGGTWAEQIAEVRKIAEHLGLDCSQPQLDAVASLAFGDSLTFRKGQIGDWRNHFGPEHKRAFKAVAGQLLIDLGYERDFDWE